jgi:hypothetical protein
MICRKAHDGNCNDVPPVRGSRWPAERIMPHLHAAVASYPESDLADPHSLRL